MKKQLLKSLSEFFKFVIAYLMIFVGFVPIFFAWLFLFSTKESVIQFMIGIPDNRYWMLGLIFIICGCFTATPLMFRCLRNYGKTNNKNNEKVRKRKN